MGVGEEWAAPVDRVLPEQAGTTEAFPRQGCATARCQETAARADRVARAERARGAPAGMEDPRSASRSSVAHPRRVAALACTKASPARAGRPRIRAARTPRSPTARSRAKAQTGPPAAPAGPRPGTSTDNTDRDRESCRGLEGSAPVSRGPRAAPARRGRHPSRPRRRRTRRGSLPQGARARRAARQRPLVAHCHLGRDKLYRRTGKREQMPQHLITATAMYREMGMRFWVEAEAETKDVP